MTDVIGEIRRYNAGRDPQRLQMKYKKMRESAFVFLRGTCHLFYKQLPCEGVLKDAPAGWICGDLHMENFGSYQAERGQPCFDISDYDEALQAPVSWDLVRLLGSVLLDAEKMGVSAQQDDALCLAMIDAYRIALVNGTPAVLGCDTATGMIRTLLDDVGDKKYGKFIKSRTEEKGTGRVLKIDGKRALAATAQQRADVTAMLDAFGARQPVPEFYRVLDVARRIAGTGSLGLERYVVLVAGDQDGKHNTLLDLRPALPSTLVGATTIEQPVWPGEAERVIALQHRGQALPMPGLYPVTLNRQAYVLRTLQPGEEKLELDDAALDEVTEALVAMARLTAWAHLRGAGQQGAASIALLGSFASREDWRLPLLTLAQGCASQVRADWAEFCAAFDGGALN